MRLSGNKIRLFSGALALSLVFILLRSRTLGHLLMWDEAWNILSLRAFLAHAARDPFYWYYKFHPPLYMFFAELLSPFKDGIDLRLEYLSLGFSFGTFLVTYFLSARIGGWKYAWLAGLVLCMMPLSMGYDTWIKRDSLAMLFGYLALLLILDKRFFWCAAALSFSLLSKESGFFFVLSCVVLVFILDKKRIFRALMTLFLTIAVLTGWWYVILSNLSGDVIGFFFSREVYGTTWTKPVFYYLMKLLPDLGPAMLLLAVIGVFYLAGAAITRKQPRWAVPMVTALCVYIPISCIFVTKTPWLSFSAAPALAMIAGGGALCLWKASRKIRTLFPVFALLIVLSALTGITFSYRDYHEHTYPNGWPGAIASRELASYLNGRMKDDDKLLISGFAYWQMPVCPVFYYYWKPHEVMIMKGKLKPAGVLKKLGEYDFDWLVVTDSPDQDKGQKKEAQEISRRLKKTPETAGWSYVWKLD